ncbi:hypothetical protein ASE37_14460 [Rhizobium sp. Root268]|nr:hypothetical protein ASC86_14465 [Rhizobium sp. Root1212]KRD24051.1 hypothetical protein ASE37_14460 [Rhizobium sp. Root268]
MQACSSLRLGAAGHEGQTRKRMSSLRNGLWSALQTHLQGLAGATLPVEPEIEILHVTLLSLSAVFTLSTRAFLQKSAARGKSGQKKRAGRRRPQKRTKP